MISVLALWITVTLANILGLFVGYWLTKRRYSDIISINKAIQELVRKER